MRRRFHPRKQWNDEGVASTVGTIMALLVFLTFLSLITNQYVPVYMKDLEAAHMGEALGQVGDFKSDIDIQMLAAQTVAAVGKHYVPVTTFATVKLGVDGVPIFSTNTNGVLTVNQTNAPWTVYFKYAISGNNTTVPEWNCVGNLPASPVACGASGGSVILMVFNKYFPQQSIAYENGALIRGQSSGQVVKAPPSFQVQVTNTSVSVDFALIQLFGSGGLAGSEAEGIQAQVIGVDAEAYGSSTVPATPITTDLYLLHNTTYGVAWYYYFNATLAGAFNIPGSYYGSKPGFTYIQTFDVGGRPTQLYADNPIYQVKAVWDGAKQWYDVTVRFKRSPSNGITPLPITSLHLLHAYVNVAVGTQGNTVGI